MSNLNLQVGETYRNAEGTLHVRIVERVGGSERTFPYLGRVTYRADTFKIPSDINTLLYSCYGYCSTGIVGRDLDLKDIVFDPIKCDSKSIINKLELGLLNQGNIKLQKGRSTMIETIRSSALSVRETIKPYEKYVVIAAILIAVDHFLLKGAMRDRIKALGIKLGERLTGILDTFISKIGG